MCEQVGSLLAILELINRRWVEARKSMCQAESSKRRRKDSNACRPQHIIYGTDKMTVPISKLRMRAPSRARKPLHFSVGRAKQPSCSAMRDSSLANSVGLWLAGSLLRGGHTYLTTPRGNLRGVERDEDESPESIQRCPWNRRRYTR